MEALEDHLGRPLKDAAGNPIKNGSTVIDSMFGEGIARGTVALENGNYNLREHKQSAGDAFSAFNSSDPAGEQDAAEQEKDPYAKFALRRGNLIFKDVTEDGGGSDEEQSEEEGEDGDQGEEEGEGETGEAGARIEIKGRDFSGNGIKIH